MELFIPFNPCHPERSASKILSPIEHHGREVEGPRQSILYNADLGSSPGNLPPEQKRPNKKSGGCPILCVPQCQPAFANSDCGRKGWVRSGSDPGCCSIIISCTCAFSPALFFVVPLESTRHPGRRATSRKLAAPCQSGANLPSPGHANSR